MGDGIWDPLWEYVLDDYDGDDSVQKSRHRKQKEKQKVPSSMFFDQFDDDESEVRQRQFENRDDSEGFGRSWKRGSRDEKTGKRRSDQGISKSPSDKVTNTKAKNTKIQTSERSSKNGKVDSQTKTKKNGFFRDDKTRKRHPWRQNQATAPEEQREDESSLWDLFVPLDTKDQMPSQRRDQGISRSPSDKETNKAKNTKIQTSERSSKNGNVDSQTKTKKKGFFRRPLRKKKDENEGRQAHADDNNEGERVSAYKPLSSERQMRQTRGDGREESFDPISMIFEVAEKLDPWASDSDSHSRSHSETTTSDGTDHTDDESTKTAKDTTESQNNEPPPQTNLVEIRLKHKPKRDDSSDDKPPTTDNAESADSPEELAPASPLQRSRASIGTSLLPDPKPLKRDNAVVRPFFPSDEETLDPSVSDPNDFQLALRRYSEEEQRAGWKRVVCCSLKNRVNKNSVHQLNTEDVKEVFPATRMVSDDNSEFSSIIGQRADYVNGVMGIPSDRFLKTRGPQSLYAYDYESNEHMDVLYAQSGIKARNSLFVRKLGPPSAFLSSSNGDDVVIQVEASTVSETDSIVRMGNWWGTDTAPLPNTPGVDVVGKVYHIKEGATSKFNLHPRQTVLSLVKWGGNTRFMTIGPEKLVKVPEGLDPAQAACLPETYLTAFQVLHFGQVGAIRYRENSLTGKSVLIVGSMANNMGKAIIELALNGGAANIYATAKKKHWKTLITYGIMPLSPEPLDWILRLEGTIDLVLASNGGLREDVTAIHYRALSPTGHLILSGRRIVGNDISVGDWRGRRTQSPIVCSKNKALAKILNRTHSYDVYEQWERDLENCKKDLSHLVNLLQRGVVKPTVLDRIPLNKVPRAHELLESKRLSGFLVCEPWMRSKKRAVYV